MHQTIVCPEKDENIAQHPDYQNEIAEVLRSNLTPTMLRERMLTYHENDIAASLEALNRNTRSRLYSTGRGNAGQNSGIFRAAGYLPARTQHTPAGRRSLTL